jgi:diguanylate cyclase (GGDEF)-like protein/PAS domain S-box-containing protein
MLVVSIVLTWQFALQDLVRDEFMPVFDRVVTAAYPVLDVALAVLVLRMLIGWRTRIRAAVGLVVGLSLWMVPDFVYLIDADLVAWWLDAGWVLGAALMGWAVAVLGSDRSAVTRELRLAEEVTPGRILLGILPLLLPGAIEVGAFLQGEDPDPRPLFAATALLAGLAMVRAVRLSRRASSARDRLAAQERHYRALVANSADAVLVVGSDGRVLSSSGNLEGLVGGVPDDVRGHDIRELLRPTRVLPAEAAFRSALASPESVIPMELEVRHANGGTRWLSARAMSLVDDPAVGGVVVNLHDITDQKQVEAELSHQAFHDSLTGLANRALFADRTEQAMRRAARTADDPVVLYLDVDGFKKINDSLGHSVGDAVLGEIAARLAAAVRDGDTVGRLGGDEFVILVEGSGADDATAAGTADRVLAALREPVEAAGHQIRLSASLGICRADGDMSVSDVVRNADLAMYQAKAAGKDRWVRWEPAMSEHAVQRLELEVDLLEAIDAGQMRVVYQPVVDLGSESIAGFEALLRWDHPTLGEIPPDRFIPIAEESGMILPLGRWVLQQACAAAARWRRDRDTDLHIAVNVSGRQLGSSAVVTDVAETLAASGLPASALVLEITESSLVEDPARAATRLWELRDLGVRLAIDDFGTGYSSLSYLRQFPVDILKIDRSFIDSIEDPGRLPPLVRALLALGRTLDVEIVAEGIERSVQRDLLQRQHCDFGQGFLFARPLSEQEADELVAGGARRASSSAG